MNIKNKLFLGIVLLSAVVFINGMQRTDDDILNSVTRVVYRETPSAEHWLAQLSNGKWIRFVYFLNRPHAEKAAMLRDYLDRPELFLNYKGNFKGSENKQKAIDYLRQKYYSQELGHKLTQ